MDPQAAEYLTYVWGPINMGPFTVGVLNVDLPFILLYFVIGLGISSNIMKNGLIMRVVHGFAAVVVTAVSVFIHELSHMIVLMLTAGTPTVVEVSMFSGHNQPTALPGNPYLQLLVHAAGWLGQMTFAICLIYWSRQSQAARIGFVVIVFSIVSGMLVWVIHPDWGSDLNHFLQVWRSLP